MPRHAKLCPKCNVDRPLDRSYDYRAQCANCLAENDSAALKPDARRRPSETPRDPIARRAYRLGVRYGMTLKEYHDMLREQGGKCAICGTNDFGPYEVPAVDHCHTTGRIRGLLCTTCNSGIGMMRDNDASLLNAIKYLRQKEKPA